MALHKAGMGAPRLLILLALAAAAAAGAARLPGLPSDCFGGGAGRRHVGSVLLDDGYRFSSDPHAPGAGQGDPPVRGGAGRPPRPAPGAWGGRERRRHARRACGLCRAHK